MANHFENDGKSNRKKYSTTTFPVKTSIFLQKTEHNYSLNENLL